MTPDEFLVTGGGLALIAVLAWYFFAPRTAAEAQVEAGR
jgi:Cu+-exporting ATPase